MALDRWDRRTFLGRSAAVGAGAAGAVMVGGEALAHGRGRGEGRPVKRYSFSVMGTTDLHGNVFNWDYFTDREYDDAAHTTSVWRRSRRWWIRCGGRRGGGTRC